MDEQTAQRILNVMPTVELSMSLPAFLINVYFAIRFNRLECFSPSFRILLVCSNLISSLSTVIHPIPHLMAKDWYSVEKGNYGGAIVVYGLHYFAMVLIIITDTKYIALQNREIYEMLDGSGAKRILTYYVISVSLFVSAKSSIMFLTSTEASIDDRLEYAFIAQNCFSYFMSLTVMAGSTWIFGACVWQFLYLSHLVKKLRYSGKNLSESFQIKQISTVVKVILPLLFGYIFAVIVFSISQFYLVYLYLFVGVSTKSALYQLNANISYLPIPLYSMFATVYMAWYFKAVRRLILKDIHHLFGIQLDQKLTAKTKPTCPKNETQIYFDTLQQMWNS
ncbi:hypothetical protein M3Y98_00021900 [Aphelenchoides besseyi]|nr:hypothetical protein M3Y98_00021900 [Aphelenchoides besseyi]KAI6199259.1 hypothetical protein M3Y96_00607800 [Aphelenchoides besseyi]